MALPPEAAALAEAFAQAVKQALEAPEGATPEIGKEWRDLGRKAAALRRIYLDKNVCIWLRDVELGRTRDPRHERILTSLTELVERGTHACPASDVLFVEILGQRDRVTRIATAKVVDRLAAGLALAPYRRRVEIEPTRWIMKYMAPSAQLGDSLEAVWLPLPHLLGPLMPQNDALPRHVNEALQYAWLHASSQLGLAEMLEMLPEPPELEESKEAFADRMTEGKEAHSAGQSFEELLQAELEGGVESFAPEVESAVNIAAHLLTGAPSGPLKAETVRAYARLVSTAHREGKPGPNLRTLQVAASYHATIRADPARRYKKGDWLDAIHAAAAIPYCDILFTESSLRHLLTTKPAQLAERFGCDVYSDPDDMLAVLETECGAS